MEGKARQKFFQQEKSRGSGGKSKRKLVEFPSKLYDASKKNESEFASVDFNTNLFR